METKCQGHNAYQSCAHPGMEKAHECTPHFHTSTLETAQWCVVHIGGCLEDTLFPVSLLFYFLFPKTPSCVSWVKLSETNLHSELSSLELPIGNLNTTCRTDPVPTKCPETMRYRNWKASLWRYLTTSESQIFLWKKLKPNRLAPRSPT